MSIRRRPSASLRTSFGRLMGDLKAGGREEVETRRQKLESGNSKLETRN